jgi:Spy/CpxP family protein refolding chaperone
VKLSRGAIVIYVGLVFACGALLGAFAQRLYTVSSVSAKAAPRNPEEFRKRVVAEYKGRLNLTDQQVSKLNEIMDETRASVEETRRQMRPAYQKIHEAQVQKIRAMLTPEQQIEHEKMLKEREERQKKNGRPQPPGF